MEILCLIPARGGSKRIPKKNIAPLLGRPMIEYVFEAVKKSRFVNRIILTSDDEEIAQVARKNGIEVPFLRPKELAQDESPTEPAILHALDFLKKEEGYFPEIVLLVQPTSPLIKSEQIDQALKLLISNQKLDSVETITEVPTVFHPYNIRYIDKKGFTRFLMERQRKKAKKTGQKPQMYAIGNLYAFRTKSFLETGLVQGKKSKSIIIDRESALDVDEPYDLKIAACLLQKGKNL